MLTDQAKKYLLLTKGNNIVDWEVKEGKENNFSCYLIKSNFIFLLENVCVMWFLFAVTARMDLINGSIDYARLAPANQLSPKSPHPAIGNEILALWLPGEVGQGGPQLGGEGLLI